MNAQNPILKEAIDIIETLLDEFDSKPAGWKREIGVDSAKQISEFLSEHRPESVYSEIDEDLLDE